VCVSRAPLARLSAYKKRMGLTVRWVSSLRSDFNYDFGVSLRPGDDPDKVPFNFGTTWFYNRDCLNRSVAETEFEPIYAEMNRRGAILFVHPAGTGICSPFINDYRFRAAAGTSLEERPLSCT
jgi:predicted dithiol-disulfide oxidoreductase (DUF899 family)